LAVLLTGWLQIARVAGDTVVMDVLAIGQIGNLGIAADAERAIRALLDKLDLTS
jgi:hypothetical protein